MTTQKLTQGVHHVGLTVPELGPTKRFFLDALGFEEVGGRPAYPAVFVSDGAIMLTLWQASGCAAFDRRGAAGLHHLALALADGKRLDDVHAALAARDDVAVEFAPEPLGAAGARHMMLSVPGGIRLELISPTGV